MLMGLLIGSVLGIVIANLTHNQQKKKHAQMAATEVTATADATAGDVATPMEEQMHTAGDAIGTDAALCTTGGGFLQTTGCRRCRSRQSDDIHVYL